MKLEYRIVEGTLKNLINKTEVAIQFAISELKNGLFYFDIYIMEESFRDNYYKNENLLNSEHSIVGKTDNQEDIRISNLFLTGLTSEENSKIRYVCEGYLEITTPSEYKDIGRIKSVKTIRFVEVEGLNLFLADHTTKDYFRRGQRMKKFSNFDFDHYSAYLMCNTINQGANHFGITIFKNTNNDNHLIKFEFKHKEASLTIDSYNQIKDDFMSLLSFANNGIVKVRRELFGKFSSEDQNSFINSSKYKIYSFRELTKPVNNPYLPIHKKVHGSKKILKLLLKNCLDSFILENRKLNLSNAIQNLINAESVAIEERYYILITLLEKLASKLHKSRIDHPVLPEGREVISSIIFDDIKKDLAEVMTKYKDRIPNLDTYNSFLSKIGNLNTINKNGTTEVSIR